MSFSHVAGSGLGGPLSLVDFASLQLQAAVDPAQDDAAGGSADPAAAAPQHAHPGLAARELVAGWTRPRQLQDRPASALMAAAAAGGRGLCGGDFCGGLVPARLARSRAEVRALTLPAAWAGRGPATRVVSREVVVEEKRRREAEGAGGHVAMVVSACSREPVRVDTGRVQVGRRNLP